MGDWKSLFSKRWFSYLIVLFLLWYSGVLVLVTWYDITASPAAFIGVRIYQPLIILFFAYRFFRRSRNTWEDRLITAFGWILIAYVISVFLIEPVYGYDKSALLTWQSIQSHWINVVAVLVGGMVAPKPKLTPERKKQIIQEIKNRPKTKTPSA